MNWGGCGCGRTPCDCNINCSNVCTQIQIQNSFNIPACNQTAVLTVPGLRSIVVGAYLWNPTYGYFLVSSMNGVTCQIIITNLCSSGNTAPGTIIPAFTLFTVSPPPVSNIIDFSSSIVFSATVSMTFTVNTINAALYSYIGPKLVWFQVDAIGTTGGTASYGIIHTLPVNAADYGGSPHGDVVDGTSLPAAGVALFPDPTHNQVSKSDGSNWSLAGSRRIITSGIYEAA